MAAPQGVNFDGTNDYLLKSSDLTGNADSKLVTGSFWVRFGRATLGAGVAEYIYASYNATVTAFGLLILRSDDEKVYIVGYDSSGNADLQVNTSAIADTDWHHIMFSFDMSDTGKRHIYVDDVSGLNVMTYNNDTLDLTHDNHQIGGFITSSLFDGDLADFWLEFGTYIDLSVASNRRKFVGASAASSVDLGSDGSNPTGSSPIMFFSGATSTWHTNDGTGGGFTEIGALTDASANPPDYALEDTTGGSLFSQAATIDGSSQILFSASGALVATAADIAGMARLARRSSGALLVDQAIITGSAGESISASGSLDAQPAQITGSGERLLAARGSLRPDNAAVAGTASFPLVYASGNLLSGGSFLVGRAKLPILHALGDLFSALAALDGQSVRLLRAGGFVLSGYAEAVGTAKGIKRVNGIAVSQEAAIEGITIVGDGWTPTDPGAEETWESVSGGGDEVWTPVDTGSSETWQ